MDKTGSRHEQSINRFTQRKHCKHTTFPMRCTVSLLVVLWELNGSKTTKDEVGVGQTVRHVNDKKTSARGLLNGGYGK